VLVLCVASKTLGSELVGRGELVRAYVVAGCQYYCSTTHLLVQQVDERGTAASVTATAMPYHSALPSRSQATPSHAHLERHDQ